MWATRPPMAKSALSMVQKSHFPVYKSAHY